MVRKWKVNSDAILIEYGAPALTGLAQYKRQRSAQRHDLVRVVAPVTADCGGGARGVTANRLRPQTLISTRAFKENELSQLTYCFPLHTLLIHFFVS